MGARAGLEVGAAEVAVHRHLPIALGVLCHAVRRRYVLRMHAHHINNQFPLPDALDFPLLVMTCKPG